MEAMQKAMENGSDENAYRSQEDNPRIDGVERRKYFPNIGLQWGDRAHAAEDHGGIEQGIDPGQAFQIMIAQYPNRKGKAQQCRPDQSVTPQALGKYLRTG